MRQLSITTAKRPSYSGRPTSLKSTVRTTFSGPGLERKSAGRVKGEEAIFKACEELSERDGIVLEFLMLGLSKCKMRMCSTFPGYI